MANVTFWLNRPPCQVEKLLLHLAHCQTLHISHNAFVTVKIKWSKNYFIYQRNCYIQAEQTAMLYGNYAIACCPTLATFTLLKCRNCPTLHKFPLAALEQLE